MTGADIVQSELGFDGTGLKVGVVDTGFDLDHPDLGGDGTGGAAYANSRVVAQYDFVGDAYNADPASAAYSPIPVPGPDRGRLRRTRHARIRHRGRQTGAVQGRRVLTWSFGAYRVFGCDGAQRRPTSCSPRWSGCSANEMLLSST